MDSVLFLGGVYSDFPLLRALQNRSLFVTILNNAPVDSVNSYANQYLNIDYSDKAAVLDIAREQKTSFIISGCNDAAYLTCAYVAEVLNLPGYDSFETALILHHKDRFRAFMKENGFSSQNFLKCTDSESYKSIDQNQLKFPVVIKPVDRSGGKGISIVDSMSEIENALDKAFESTMSGDVIIEDFKAGELKSFSAFVIDGEIRFSFFDHEYAKYNPFQVSSSMAPLENKESIKEKLKKAVTDIVNKLSLVDGLIHTQFLLDGDNYHIVEITRRTPGDLYALPVHLLTGIEYSQLTLNAYMGESLELEKREAKTGYTIRHCPAVENNGVIEGFHISASIQNYLVESIKYLDVGDVVDNHRFQRMGVFILFFTDKKQATETFSNIDNLIHVSVG